MLGDYPVLAPRSRTGRCGLFLDSQLNAGECKSNRPELYLSSRACALDVVFAPPCPLYGASLADVACLPDPSQTRQNRYRFGASYGAREPCPCDFERHHRCPRHYRSSRHHLIDDVFGAALDCGCGCDYDCVRVSNLFCSDNHHAHDLLSGNSPSRERPKVF